MPKVGQKRKPEVVAVDITPEDEAGFVEAAWDKFTDSRLWKRSKKGNLWRHWQGKTVTIFTRSDNYFGWSIATSENIRYSGGGFENESEAMECLGSALNVSDSWMD